MLNVLFEKISVQSTYPAEGMFSKTPSLPHPTCWLLVFLVLENPYLPPPPQEIQNNPFCWGQYGYFLEHWVLTRQSESTLQIFSAAFIFMHCSSMHCVTTEIQTLQLRGPSIN